MIVSGLGNFLKRFLRSPAKPKNDFEFVSKIKTLFRFRTMYETIFKFPTVYKTFFKSTKSSLVW